MKEVRLKKAKLLAIIKKNRQEHHDIFLAAQAKYREQVRDIMEAELGAIRLNKPFKVQRLLELTMPENHSSDYDRAIQMLELSVDQTVVLSTADFSNLVQDQWNWSRQWAASNSRYVDSPKFRSLE